MDFRLPKERENDNKPFKLSAKNWHERHYNREEETSRRYSSWKKEHMRGIPTERRKQVGDIPVGRRNP